MFLFFKTITHITPISGAVNITKVMIIFFVSLNGNLLSVLNEKNIAAKGMGTEMININSFIIQILESRPMQC